MALALALRKVESSKGVMAWFWDEKLQRIPNWIQQLKKEISRMNIEYWNVVGNIRNYDAIRWISSIQNGIRNLVTHIGTTWSFVSKYWGRLDFNYLTFHHNLRSSFRYWKNFRFCFFVSASKIANCLHFESWAILWDFHKRTCTDPWAYQKHKSASVSGLRTPFLWGKLSANWYNMPLFLWHMLWPRGQIRCPVTSSR